MKRNLTYGSVTILILLVLFGGCTTADLQYMSERTDDEGYFTPGQPGYESFTARLLGSWTAISFNQMGEEQLGSKYKEIRVGLSAEPRDLIIEFVLTDEFTQVRAKDWLAKDPTLYVYDYIKTYVWKGWQPVEAEIALYDVDYIDLNGSDLTRDFVIEGGGDSMETFWGWESMMGPALGLPYLPVRFLVEIIDDETLRLYSYEQKGILHWNRDVIVTELLLKKTH